MATPKAILANIGALYGAYGRSVDEVILEAYKVALGGDACSDYQLGRSVTKLITEPSSYPPSAGVVRDRARNEPRDPAAALERLRLEESDANVVRGGKYEPLRGVTPQLKDATAVEDFDFESEMAKAGFDVEAMRRKHRGGGALQRAAREYDAKTFAQRQAEYRRIVSQLDK